jgi:hypothetical protein
MRRLLTTSVAAAGLFAAVSLVSGGAQAMTVTAPAGLTAALQEMKLAEDVAYYCRRVRRCGYGGCVWRRVCRHY